MTYLIKKRSWPSYWRYWPTMASQTWSTLRRHDGAMRALPTSCRLMVFHFRRHWDRF